MENEAATESSIVAVFTYALYYSPDWQVCRYRNRETDSTFVAVGKSLPVQRNLLVELFGTWTRNRKDGRNQFSVSRYETAAPSSEPEIVAYFASLRCGVGTRKAKAVYRYFGADTWSVLETEPRRLTEVPGIGQKALDRILSAMEQNQSSKKLVKLFAKAGVTLSGSSVLELTSLFGESAADILSENPYLAYLQAGMPYDKAEALAFQLGIARNAPSRLSAIACRILNDAAMNGHVCLPKEDVLFQLRRDSACTDRECRDAINDSCRTGSIRFSGERLYIPARLDDERNICAQIMRLKHSGHGPVEAIDALIRQYEQSHFELAESQRNAIQEVFRSQISIITGGPGVGKTTVSKAILSVHSSVFGRSSKPILLAPTGKASRRLSEITGYPAETIHSAIGWRGDKLPCPNDMLDGNLILVDEVSMLDQHICSLLLSRISSDSRLVLIGDVDQLPSVGCGNVLHDLIASEVIPVTRLSVIFRQADGNPIIRNIHAVNEGRTDLIESEFFRFFEIEKEEELFRETVRLYLQAVSECGEENVLLLNPQRNNTNLSVDRFNSAIQSVLNPGTLPGREMKVGRTVFRIGDRIMQLRNSEFAMNGDIGYIKDIYRKQQADNTEGSECFAAVEFNHDSIIHEYAADEMRFVSHAWCMTVHKAQGTEQNTVIQVISKAHPSMLKRQIVYTGLSRGKERVIVTGDREAFQIAVENGNQEFRSTLLAERLVSAEQKYSLSSSEKER